MESKFYFTEHLVSYACALCQCLYSVYVMGPTLRSTLLTLAMAVVIASLM